MRKQKNQPAQTPPRRIGDILVTEAVHARRKWSKKRPDTKQGHLWESQARTTAPAASRHESEEERTEATTNDPCGDAAAGGVSSLFQSIGHCCDKTNSEDRQTGFVSSGEVIDYVKRVRPCDCRKWYCKGCGPKLGKRLRGRLLDRLKAFKNVFGVTLTVDPSLFDSPEEAWQYVMQNRLLSRFVRELDRRGCLHSKAYFWVVEFQSDTEFAHWHLLLDASRIPFGDLVEIWSRNRPDSEGNLRPKVTAENYQGQAPEFGSVRFTVRGDNRKAGFYASKYLVKFPKNGFPDWVLDRTGRMPRYGRSNSFFPKETKHDSPENEDAKKAGGSSAISKRPHQLATIRERIAKCGESCNILEVAIVELGDGTQVDGRVKFVEKLDLPYREACARLGADETKWEVQLHQGDEAILFAGDGEDVW